MLRSLGVELVGRGVYPLPFLSPEGHRYLVAISAEHTLVSKATVPVGDNPLPILEHLWDLLNAQDPLPEPAPVRTPNRIPWRNALIVAGLLLLVHVADPIVLIGHIF